MNIENTIPVQEKKKKKKEKGKKKEKAQVKLAPSPSWSLLHLLVAQNRSVSDNRHPLFSSPDFRHRQFTLT